MIALEILRRQPAGDAPRTPLLFLHGAYVGAWCWDEHFLPWFAARGFPCYALSLRGHGASGGRERLHQYGIGDYVDDLAQAVSEIDELPVLVGHSMGALVVQKYLERASARAVVHVCPVPPFGLLPSTFSLAFGRPQFFAEINSLAGGHSASRSALAEALFAGTVDAERIDRHYARMQAESRRALMDMTLWGLPQVWRMARVDALVLGASEDALISPALAQSAAAVLGAEYRLLDGLGHAVMLETAWESAAQEILDWLTARGL